MPANNAIKADSEKRRSFVAPFCCRLWRTLSVSLMKESEFRKLKGWVDYERYLLDSLTPAQRIRYFQKRLDLVLLRPLELMFRNICARKRRSSALLCWATCINCSIEALGKFYTGQTDKNGSGVRFKKFVRKFMSHKFPQLKFKGRPYLDILWDSYRNGLAHGFPIKDGGFEFQRKYFELKTFHGKTQIEIDPQRFHGDFIHSIKKYLKYVKQSSPNGRVRKRFDKAFVDIFVIGK